MSLWAFPILATLLLFLIVIPGVTLVAKGMLVFLRSRCDDLADFGSAPVYLGIVGPTMGPILWSVSAALHQAEPDRILASCLHPHLGDPACTDALTLAFLIAAIPTIPLLALNRRRRAADKVLSSHQACEARGRLHRLCHEHPVLRRWCRRVWIVEEAPMTFCTRGLLRPRIEVDARVAVEMDDDQLVAALLHEVSHARDLDPLRIALAQVALAVNPFGGLLRSELQRWRAAREARCDSEAVDSGAKALALAAAIVGAARPRPCPTPASPLAVPLGGELRVVQLRVQRLLGGTGVGKRRERSFWIVAAASLLLLLSLPHAVGTAPLDIFHRGVESIVHPVPVSH